MLDIDDSKQLALVDRRRWLQRAAARRERWAAAWAWGVAQKQRGRDTVDATSSESQRGTVVLEGILDTLRRCGINVDRQRAVQALRAEAGLTVDGHPADLFLGLLALFDDQGERRMPALSLESEDDLARCAHHISSGINPAKRLARHFSERLPVFWAVEELEGVARDWRNRWLLYAEAHAVALHSEEVRHLQVMARFPRYWPRSSLLARLGWIGEEPLLWLSQFEPLMRQRGFPVHSVVATEPDVCEAALYLLELGEWIALYGAALNGIDPADRVPLDLLHDR